MMKRVLVYGAGGPKGGAAPPPTFPMEYVWTEGNGAPYEIYYDDEMGSGPTLVSNPPNDSFNITAISGQRKLVRLSDRKMYAIFPTKAVANYTEVVRESIDEGATWVNQTQIGNGWTDAAQDSGFSAIVVDSLDLMTAIWDSYVTFWGQIVKVEWNGAAWQAQTVISTGIAGMTANHQSGSALGLDSLDGRHAVWRGRSGAHLLNGQIWYRPSPWIAVPVRLSTLLGMDTAVQLAPTIALDGNDVCHVAWAGRAPASGFNIQQIWYVENSAGWTAPVRISVGDNMVANGQNNVSIATDSSDVIHVVWHGRSGTWGVADQIWYRRFSGGTWNPTPPTRLSTFLGMNTTAQNFPSISVDDEDNIHVLWQGFAGGVLTQSIWYSTSGDGGGTWSAPITLQTAVQNQRPILRWRRWPTLN